MDLFTSVQKCIAEDDAHIKAKRVRELAEQWRAYQGSVLPGAPVTPISAPGRPHRPTLVSPRDLPRRSLHTSEGHAALIHSIAHIEFNAINLALDAAYRFRDLPKTYYDDWMQVAGEEAYHFQLVSDHLKSLGYEYGAFTAHNGLWEMAQKTADDPLVRMALVPRVLEARGLDVTPGISKKLADRGDKEAVAILDIIFRDEIGHVKIGTRWFHYFCAERNLEPDATFRGLFESHMGKVRKGRAVNALHHDARIAAGFSENEMAFLEGES